MVEGKEKKEKSKGHLPVCFAKVEGVGSGRQNPLYTSELVS